MVREPRLTLHDGTRQNARQSRFESMVNLGVAMNTASASDLLNRNAPEDNTVRPTLIVREEGKPATQFVSTFFGHSPLLLPVCGDPVSSPLGTVAILRFADAPVFRFSNSATVLAEDSSERYTGR